MFLEVKDLIKSYADNLPVLKKLNFQLQKGELLSFVGESGAGKSTFLKCLSGLEKIDGGEIILNGKIISSHNTFIPPQQRKISYVFQDYALFPHLNIRENICFNLDIKFNSNFDSVVSLTNLKSILNRYPHEISGGEQQRACIARSIIREPDLLLLDEPFSNLDSNIKHQVRDEICNIVKKTKTTTILVTHDINDALNISDKILVFKAGVVQQFSNPTTMYCKPANCYCAEILGDINKLSIGKKTFYIRPENIKIVKHSKLSMNAKKCFFQGKDYKIIGLYNNNIWSVFSKEPIKINSKVCFEYLEEDLIYFDNGCSNFFTE
ncbi:MAG: hypothetical protein CMC26_03610 [Flavobacteriaceae bacterium]|nr:hypothetical protein [Flavobacteriaceae bacterium]|tara:strand:+ start:46102 stop:47067 length:966 start_codon:yes stop_codon:yes gene_type:complete